MNCKAIVLKKVKVKTNFYKILIKCNYCKKEKWVDFCVLKRGGGKFCSRKCHWKNKKGIKKPEHSKKMSGRNSPIWNGGKHKEKNRWYIYKPEHPFAKNGKYVRRSRLVAEKCLGRYLTRIEIIHHINEIKDDDRPENLYLFPRINEHTSYHMTKIKPELKSNLLKKEGG